MKHILPFVLALLAAPVAAQPQGQQLPPGHPPAQQLPAGHPPTQQAPQAPQAQQLPAGHPPLGPAEVMQQAREAREQSEQQAREQRTEQQEPTPADPMHRILGGESPELVVANPSTEVPAGTIRVRVVDGQGRPVAEQAVDVGILERGQRERLNGVTSEGGVVVFDGLEPGGEKAYRVNVPHGGATYQSTPFRLPPDQGYDVRVIRLPTTTEDYSVNARGQQVPTNMSLLTRSFLELRDTRIHIVQRVQLVNLSSETFVFPEEGKLVELPEGFTAWQWQEVMTDQRLSQVEEGFRVRGSLPPGRVDLTWAFDMPVSGSEMEIALPVPWRTFGARVEADAPKGMEIEVERMPNPDLHEVGEQRVWLTEKRFRPEETPPTQLRVELSGIPGPGPLRWLALGGAIVLLLAAVLFVFRPAGRGEGSGAALAQRRDQLVQDAVQLERMFRAEEIGPKYRRRQMDALVAELAAILRKEEAASATSEKSEASKKGARRA